MASDDSSRLLSLPAELRERIYGYVLVGVLSLPISDKDKHAAMTPLFSTCRQLFAEVPPRFVRTLDREKENLTSQIDSADKLYSCEDGDETALKQISEQCVGSDFSKQIVAISEEKRRSRGTSKRLDDLRWKRQLVSITQKLLLRAVFVSEVSLAVTLNIFAATRSVDETGHGGVPRCTAARAILKRFRGQKESKETAPDDSEQ